MRPNVLDPLFIPLTSYTGIGEKTATLIARAMGREPGDESRAVDLLLMPPHRLIDRRHQPGVAHATENTIATFKLHVDKHLPSPRGRQNVPYRVLAHDETGQMTLTFFHARQQWLEKALPIGETVLVSGKVEWYNGKPSMVHPDRMALEADAENFPMIEPVYPLTAGLSSKLLQRAIDQAVSSLPSLPEWLDEEFVSQNTFSDFKSSVERLHAPRDPGDMSPDAPARRRLAYDELLAGQLSLALVRQRVRGLPGEAVVSDGRMQESVRVALPFQLTQGQQAAVDDILADMAKPQRMLRVVAGRCRIRKNHRRAYGDDCLRGSRRPGGFDGANRNSGASAFRFIGPTRRKSRCSRRIADRTHESQSAGRGNVRH